MFINILKFYFRNLNSMNYYYKLWLIYFKYYYYHLDYGLS